jgi:hypothetical protein
LQNGNTFMSLPQSDPQQQQQQQQQDFLSHRTTTSSSSGGDSNKLPDHHPLSQSFDARNSRQQHSNGGTGSSQGSHPYVPNWSDIFPPPPDQPPPPQSQNSSPPNTSSRGNLLNNLRQQV